MDKVYRRSASAVIAAALLMIITITILGGCAGKSSVKKDQSGNYIAEGTGTCTVEDKDISYSVFLRVTADPNGVILSVEDDGTEVPEGKDSLFIKAQLLFSDLEGKDLNSLSEVDAVSGATCSSQAILEAVEDALNIIAQATGK